jgi:predicted Zn-dependent protease
MPGVRIDAAILAEMPAPTLESLEKLRGTPRDGALLRYSLGLEYAKAGSRERAIVELREAVARDAGYSAAWKALGRALADDGRREEALAAYASGIEAARAKGDRQAEKEMTVFARRLERQRSA